MTRKSRHEITQAGAAARRNHIHTEDRGSWGVGPAVAAALPHHNFDERRSDCHTLLCAATLDSETREGRGGSRHRRLPTKPKTYKTDHEKHKHEVPSLPSSMVKHPQSLGRSQVDFKQQSRKRAKKMINSFPPSTQPLAHTRCPYRQNFNQLALLTLLLLHAVTATSCHENNISFLSIKEANVTPRSNLNSLAR